MFVPRMSRSGALLCALLLSACSQEPATVAREAGAVVAPAATTPSTNGPVLPANSTVTQESVRIFVDPATGEIREPTTAEEAAAASRSAAPAAASKPSEARIREIHLPDGSTAVIQDKKDRDYLQGCVRADDKVTLDHGCNAK